MGGGGGGAFAASCFRGRSFAVVAVAARLAPPFVSTTSAGRGRVAIDPGGAGAGGRGELESAADGVPVCGGVVGDGSAGAGAEGDAGTGAGAGGTGGGSTGSGTVGNGTVTVGTVGSAGGGGASSACASVGATAKPPAATRRRGGRRRSLTSYQTQFGPPRMRAAFRPSPDSQYVSLMPRTAEHRDFYELLGVPRDADAKTIQKAFHEHARRSHPDVNGDAGAEERFGELSHAYAVLSDPRARLLYDRLAYRGPGGGGFGPVHAGVGHPTRETEHISDYELLSWIFGDEAPQPPADERPQDDPLVLALAAAALVTALVVLVALLLA